jgi:hypothetical protein
MAIVEEKKLKYPSEDECLVRRLGSAVIVSWARLPGEVQELLIAEAKTAWDREFHVARISDRLAEILRRNKS